MGLALGLVYLGWARSLGRCTAYTTVHGDGQRRATCRVVVMMVLLVVVVTRSMAACVTTAAGLLDHGVERAIDRAAGVTESAGRCL